MQTDSTDFLKPLILQKAVYLVLFQEAFYGTNSKLTVFQQSDSITVQ